MCIHTTEKTGKLDVSVNMSLRKSWLTLPSFSANVISPTSEQAQSADKDHEIQLQTQEKGSKWGMLGVFCQNDMIVLIEQ